MSDIPVLRPEDRERLKKKLVKEPEDQHGFYIRCDHEGGDITFWRKIAPERLVKAGLFKPLTWVVHLIDDVTGLMREYPIDEDEVPQQVREIVARRGPG